MKAKRREFDRQLDALLKIRTALVRSWSGLKRRGRLPRYTKRRANDRIAKMLDTATAILISEVGHPEFADLWTEKRQWHAKRGKGRGVDNKRSAFRDWYEDRIGTGLCVYVFWSGKNCAYVGRTGKGGSRPQSHFQKYWFAGVTRVDIYMIRLRRVLPKAECLAIHLFNPNRNKVKSASQKYRSKCPVCVERKEIEAELKSIF